MADVITDSDIEVCVAVAAQLALYFTGTPDDEMLLALDGIRSDLQARLSGEFGAEVATVIAEAFIVTVVRRRIEIEAAGETSPVLN